MNAQPITNALVQAPAPAVYLLAPLATAPLTFDRGRTLDVSSMPTPWISCAAHFGNGFTWRGTADPLLEAETVGRRAGDSLVETASVARPLMKPS